MKNFQQALKNQQEKLYASSRKKNTTRASEDRGDFRERVKNKMQTKEKLTEIIKSTVVNAHGTKLGDVFHPEFVENIVENLIKNGVIVAPMPMADWLREELTEYVRKRCLEEF